MRRISNDPKAEGSEDEKEEKREEKDMTNDSHEFDPLMKQKLVIK